MKYILAIHSKVYYLIIYIEKIFAMASSRKEQQLTMPLIQQYNKSPDLSVSHVFRLRPEELRYSPLPDLNFVLINTS